MFRIVDSLRNSAKESIPAPGCPGAVTPQLTMIAGRQLSIGAAHGDERPLYDSNIANRNLIPNSACGMWLETGQK